MYYTEPGYVEVTDKNIHTKYYTFDYLGNIQKTINSN